MSGGIICGIQRQWTGNGRGDARSSGGRPIDHGVRAGEDPALVERLAQDRVPLTVCPLSNVRLKVFADLRSHNLARLLRAGVRVTVNSDDPPYFGGYLNDNFVACIEAMDLTLAELAQLARNSLEVAVMPAGDRQRALGRLESLAAASV